MQYVSELCWVEPLALRVTEIARAVSGCVLQSSAWPGTLSMPAEAGPAESSWQSRCAGMVAITGGDLS